MNADPSAALDAGIAMAADPNPVKAQQYSREEADVKRWMDAIERARKFDEPARIQYVKDRRYARGDSGFEVDANLIGTNIDILEAFLYARDPDFDATPGPAVRPPSVDSLRDAVEEKIRALPEVMQAGRMAAAMAVAQGVPEPQALMLGQQASEAKVEELIRAEVLRMRKQFQRRQREVKNFAETCEIVGSRMWTDAQLKRRGRPMVRSGLTVGVGVIKASWQERTAPSPETVTAVNDLQANIARLEALKRQMAEGGIVDKITGLVKSWFSDDDAKLVEYQRQLQAIQAQADPVIARGFVVDNVAAEDFQVAEGFTIANHADAPWNAHRIFMRYEDACAEFGPYLNEVYGEKGEDKLKTATRYTPRRPEMVRDKTVWIEGDTSKPTDADGFVSADESSAMEKDGEGGHWVALWEIWDRDSNTVLTGVAGVKCWVKEGWNPTATTRFYPFFLFTTSEVDGQRHPQSLVTRSAKLINEYNRIGSAEAEHRRRILPKTAFDEGALSQESAKKLSGGGIQEMVGIKPTVPNKPIGDILFNVPYAPIDAALYDRSRIKSEIEGIWGTAEAVQGISNTQITATQAEIQQSGLQVRTGSRRDQLETTLSELALYTIEVARAYVTDEDVRLIAGPDAFWPPYEGPNDLLRMLTINIRAGSSGKPNTSAERQAWATQLPLLQAGITQIGQLRGSSPQAMADAFEQLLRITAERSGDRIDLDQLIPQADTAVPQMGAPAMPGVPGAPAPTESPQPAIPAPVESDPLAATP